MAGGCGNKVLGWCSRFSEEMVTIAMELDFW
jgi:hypothetical protein